MKIVIVQPYAKGPGHYDAYTKRLCEGFLKENVEIVLVTANGTFNDWSKNLPIKEIVAISSKSFLVSSLDRDSSSKRFIRRLRFFYTSWITEKKAFSYFLKNNCDAIHFIDSEIITLSILFCIFKKPKDVFFTVPAPLEILEKSFHKQLYNATRILLSKKLFKLAKPIVHSKFIADSLIKNKIVSYNIPVVSWGIDNARLTYSKQEARNKIGLLQNEYVFGFFGYILPQKGFQFLLQNLSKLNNYKILAIIHSDKIGEEDSIRKQIKDNNLNNIIIRYGFASENDLALYISACDAVLLPYKRDFIGESGIMSLTLSHEIPLIASNVGKVGETIKQHNLGIVFEPESNLEFIKALDKFSNFSKNEIELIKKNINLYISKNSWGEIARQHLSIYKNRKLKILICAYACQPHGCLKWAGPGEMILGWNMVLQISKNNKAYVLTHTANRKDIEQEKINNSKDNLNFYYISLPKQFDFLLNFEGGLHLYAYLWQIKAYFVAKKLHKENNFDIFHHVTFANDWLASYIGAFLPIPYIRGPGGGAHKTPKEFLSEYSFINRFWQKIRGFSQYILRHDPIFLIGRKKAKAILLCLYESLEIMPNKFKDKTYLFPVNGVSKDDLFLLSKNKDNKSNDFIILSAGKLFSIKGFALAIKSFKLFSDRVKNAKLIIVGDGPEKNNLIKIVSMLNIENKVIFKGWEPRQKLFNDMVNCDVFLFPSLRDGGGSVVVEAMAAGKPVVCLDIAGPGFHINENWGIKINPINPEQVINDIADALSKLYFNRDLLANLGKRARERAEEFYDWDKLGEKLQQIYLK